MSSGVLIVNVGSTSIKSRLFDAGLKAIAILDADYGAAKGLVIDGQDVQGNVIYQCYTERHHDTKAALTIVLELWRAMANDSGLLLSAIGHRIVHGADWFDTITLITEDVLARLVQLDHYAPLHNPFNRLGIVMAAEVFPDAPQFAVFDTVFHRSIPQYARRYAIPEHLSSRVEFYRYGFHGISCRHCLAVAAEMLGRDPANLNLIVLHLGGGASVTAIQSGVSIDTSMGFSPTEGLIMASRCGDLDPMIALCLQREGMLPEQLDDLLNHQSGLLGICQEADMRGIIVKAAQGDTKAILALDMYCYRIKKYIGAYCAILGDVSALIFTGGIGEHAHEIRQHILNGLDKLGFSIDPAANQQTTPQNRTISDSASRSRILVIHAEEERVCARQILNFLADEA